MTTVPTQRTYVLSDLYDADLRTTDPFVARLATQAKYADGIYRPRPAVAPSPRAWWPCGCGATWYEDQP